MDALTLTILSRFASGLAPGTVLDVGGRSVNGSCCKFWKDHGWDYRVADIDEGSDVDYVISPDSRWKLHRQFDAIICCNTLEHVREPWVLAETIGQHLHPQGKVFFLAPFSWPYHPYPIDAWRFSPDGMKVLFQYAGVTPEICELTWELRPEKTLSSLYCLFRYNLPRLIKGQHAQCVQCYGWGTKSS